MTDGAGSLAELLATRAAAEPGAPAVAAVDGPALSWGGWKRRSDALASGLLERGVRPGDRIVLVFDGGGWPDYCIAYAATMKVGAVAVPLAAPVAGLSLTSTIDHCLASGVLTSAAVAPRAGSTWTAHPGDLEQGGGRAPPLFRWRPDDVAEILYPSGPLARPLGTSRSHASLMDDLRVIAHAFGGGASAPSGAPSAVPLSPLLHAAPIGSDLAGAALGLALRGDVSLTIACPRFDPERFCRLISEQAIGTCALTASMARLLLASGAAQHHDLAGLRRVLLTVTRPPGDLLSRLAAAVPTAELVTIVRPRPDAALDVFVHDRGRPRALGRPPGRRRGGAGSDGIGYLDDEVVHLLGPGDRVISWRGRPLLAAEVEEVLGGHPGVADVSVLGLPDDDRPERVVAAVVPGSGPPGPSPPDLIRLVSRRLGQHRAPTEIAVLDDLPRNRHGVLLRRRLRERLGAPAPAPAPLDASRPVVAVVAATWERVLGTPPTSMGDEFFELGGDEVAATRILALTDDAFAAEVGLGAFLASPTVGGLAAEIDARRSGAGGPPPAIAPVAFSQEGMLWQEQFAPGCQNLPVLARRYRGTLDVAALQGALGEIVRRHEPLRANFEIRGGRALQVVHPPAPFDLPTRDLAALDAAAQDAEIEQMLAEEGSRPFDLTTDPLFSPRLLRLGDDDHVLAIRVHHSVFDDWSVAVFRRELSALYAAYAAGDPSPLADPPVAFSEFAREQRRTLAGTAGAAEVSYWRTELAGAPWTTQLPVHDPSLPAGSSQAAPDPVSLTVPAELHRQLRDLARRERTTLFMVMLAAFQVLVHRSTGQDDLLVASVVANRNRTELEGLIGCFTKKVPLRLRLAPDDTFRDVMGGVRRALMGALTHQDLPFEAMLQEVVGPSAAAHGLTPQVAVMFQGVTPRADELVLPGLATTGFETSDTSRRAHFMAAAGERAGDELAATAAAADTGAPVWGGGLYLGTFLILSVIETPVGLSCQARGAFHPPAVERLLAGFETILGDLVADPDTRVAGLPPEPATALPPSSRSVQLGGFRVDPARIEAALSTCAIVDDVAVRAVTTGGDTALVAYVVPAGPSPPTLARLRAHLWSEIPGYAWPATMVLLDALPRLPSGEVDLDAVAQRGEAVGRPPPGPATVDEQVLAAEWASVLGVQRVKGDQNYWQQFSFLDLLSPEHLAGAALRQHAPRNRTVETLATAVAAERIRSSEADRDDR